MTRVPAARARLALAALALGSCSLAGPGPEPHGGKADEFGGACGERARLEPVFEELSFTQPVALVQHPHNQLRWYVAERGGVISTFLSTASGTSGLRVFADLGDRVDAGPDEAGLLGIAFHPRFDDTGMVFLSYTAPSESAPSGIESRVTRVESHDRGRTLSMETEVVLLRVDQPFGNHNGGHLAFGPDGLLYVGLGDGGSAGDPLGVAQNPHSLLGKLLRIDVDAPEESIAAYAIPGDNPFAEGGGAAEVFALGLRNPWRFSFDSASGELWLADVGQDRFEEVNVVEVGQNYGWPILEGTHCFGVEEEEECDREGLIDPRAEYGRAAGVSVTGGYVYRGITNPSLAGRYVFADFGSGNFFSIDAASEGEGPEDPELLFPSALHPSTFARDSEGELYVVDYLTGTVFGLVAGGDCAGPNPGFSPLSDLDGPPTFELLHQEVFSVRCSPCHTIRAFGELSLANLDGAFDALVGQAAATVACEGRTRVVPGDPESSVLYQKVSGINLCGPAMPPDGDLDEVEVEAIRAWIAGGAPR